MHGSQVSKIELHIGCGCDTPICDHTVEKLGELLQDTYDDGYDEGWKEAFLFMRRAMRDAGSKMAEKLPIPDAPPRTGKLKKPSRASGKHKGERTH